MKTKLLFLLLISISLIGIISAEETQSNDTGLLDNLFNFLDNLFNNLLGDNTENYTGISSIEQSKERIYITQIIDEPIPLNGEIKFYDKKISNKEGVIIISKKEFQPLWYKNKTTEIIDFEIRVINPSKETLVGLKEFMGNLDKYNPIYTYSDTSTNVLIIKDSKKEENETHFIITEYKVYEKNYSNYKPFLKPKDLNLSKNISIRATFDIPRYTKESFNISFGDKNTNYLLDPELGVCGTLSTANATYVLNTSLNATGTCMTVSAPNITLDCNGYTINYSTGGTANTYGVYSNQFNTTIKNCKIVDGNLTSTTNTRYGIYSVFASQTSAYHLIYNNSINTSSSRGIYTYYSDRMNISLNNITTYTTASFNHGIIFERSSNNTINNNNIFSGLGIGIYIYLSSHDNNVTNNNASGGASGSRAGIWIQSSSRNNISNNNATGISSANGIYLEQSSQNNTIANNNARSQGSGVGIYITGSTGNNLTNNNGTSLSANGIYLVTNADNNILTNNYGSSNSSNGIQVYDGSDNNILINNTGISAFAGHGIYIYSGTNNTLNSNTGVSNSGYGLYIRTETSSNFVGNNGTSNTGIGNYIQSSSNNTLTNNIAVGTGSGSYGIYIISSANNTFKDCQTISGVLQDVNYATGSGSTNNTFLNCSYNLSKETIVPVDGQLIRKWYYQTYVNYSNSTAVSNAQVTAYNSSNDLRFNVSTNSTGYIPVQSLTEYQNIGGTRTYASNYTLNASKGSLVSNQLSRNITTNTFGDYLTINLAPSCVLISKTPTDIASNSTGVLSIVMNCSSQIPLNLTKLGGNYRFFITRTVDAYTVSIGIPNYFSVRYPNNSLGVVSPLTPPYKIWRALGRNEGDWYESLTSQELINCSGISQCYRPLNDTYSYAIEDDEYGHFTLIPSPDNKSVIINYTHPAVSVSAFSQVMYISWESMIKEQKKNITISNNNPVLIKDFDLQAYRSNKNYSVNLFTNLGVIGSPTKEERIFYCNSSYNPLGSTQVINSPNCVLASVLTPTEINNKLFTEKNSTYIRNTFSVTNGLFAGIITTTEYYLSIESPQTSASNYYQLRYANGTTNSDVSFSNTNVSWTSTDGGVTWIKANWTADIFTTFVRAIDNEFQFGYYIEDILGNAGYNFTFITDEITPVNDPISSPNILAYNSSAYPNDYNINETHKGIMKVLVGVSKDPDSVGNVTHNLTLRNLDGTYNYTINGSFKSLNDENIWIRFNTSLVPDGKYRMNILAIAGDNLNDTKNRTTDRNFTINNSYVVVYSPLNVTYHDNENININWTIPVGYYVANYTLKLKYSNGTTKQNITILSGTNLGYTWNTDCNNGDETYYILVSACDEVNECSNGISNIFSVVNTPPIINIFSPLNTTYYSTSISLNVFGVDYSTPISYAYKLDSSPYVSFTPNITLNTTGYEVYHDIIVGAIDSCGYYSNKSARFYVGITSNGTAIPIVTPSCRLHRPLFDNINIGVIRRPNYC